MLRVHSGAIRRVTISWRRGAGPYVPIPGATVEFGELLKKEPDEKGDGKPQPDQRLSDPAAWALDVATGRWRAGVEWAKKNGPVIDAQLSGWAYDSKKGTLSIIKGCVSAKRINLTGEGANWMDGPAPGTTEWMNVQLLLALNEKDKRINEFIERIGGHYQNIGNTIQANNQLTMSIAQNIGEGIANGGQSDRQFYLELAKINMMGEGINKSIDQGIPVLRDLVNAWQPGGGNQEIPELAKKLYESLTTQQRDTAKEMELGDLWNDLISGLEKLVETGADKQAAQNILGAVVPKLFQKQDELEKILTEEQRAIVVALIKAAGFQVG